VPINSLGFREREVDPKKPEGAARIICMGDSCTAQGKPGYAGYLHEMLSKNPPTPRTWEAFNLAVYGYSSLQGLRLYQKLGHTLDPDIVTLYYGWNDHWLHEQTDRQRMAWHVDAWAGRMIETLREKRFFMLMMWAMKSQRARKLDSITSEYRVPPEEYREVLTRFIQDIRNSDAVPLLITAPRRSLQPSVVNSGHAHSLTEAETVHDRYVRITREVADTCNVELLDLAVIFDTPEADAYFKPDGIHFTQEGLKQIATELYHSITPLSIRMARTQPDNIQHKP
jgi:lysophospholipase L1-like esterase